MKLFVLRWLYTSEKVSKNQFFWGSRFDLVISHGIAQQGCCNQNDWLLQTSESLVSLCPSSLQNSSVRNFFKHQLLLTTHLSLHRNPSSTFPSLVRLHLTNFISDCCVLSCFLTGGSSDLSKQWYLPSFHRGSSTHCPGNLWLHFFLSPPQAVFLTFLTSESSF